MISLAFWATVINYLDRQTFSVAAPVLREQFHMSNVDYSRVVFAFLLAYTIMNGVSGPLIDRLGTRLGYGLCIAWWSIAAMLHALSRGAVSLGVYRFLLGMGEAGNWPGAVKVVAEWFPESERALAAGLFNSGSSVGAILAPPIVAFLLLKWGWQSAFLFVGMAGLVWLACWARLYRTPAAPAGGASVPPVPLGVLLRSRFVWVFTVSKIFLDPVWYFYIFWFPEYLKRVRNFDLAAIGKFAWIPFLVAGFGNLLGGWLFRLSPEARRIRDHSAQIRRDLLCDPHDHRHPRRAGAGGMALHRFGLGGDARLYRQPGQHAHLSGGCVSRQRRRLGIRVGQHGRRLWRHGLHPHHGVGGGSLFLYAGLHRIWHPAAGVRVHPLGVPRSAAPSGAGAAPQILPNFATASLMDRNFSMNGIMVCSVLSRS
jgi:MFS family permease